MAKNCGAVYDPDLHFKQVKRIRRFSDDWKKDISDLFEPDSASMLIELLENPQLFTEEQTLKTYQKNKTIELVDANDSLDEDWMQANTSIRNLYHTDYKATVGRVTPTVAFNRMMYKFHDRIMSKLVFDLETKRQIKVTEMLSEYNLDKLNFELLQYKKELIRNIAEFTHSDISELDTADNNTFAKILNNVLLDYSNQKKNDNSESVYDDYIVLANFNELLESEFDWIKVKSVYLQSKTHGLDMYTYSDPKVKHRKSFDSDKMVGAEEQTSNYLKRLLDYIPIVDADGNPVTWQEGDTTVRWTVGYGNFERVITTIKDWLYTDPNVRSKIRKEYKKGAEGDFDSIIQEYIDNGMRTAEYGTSLSNELYAIKKYLLGNDTDWEIKELIISQMYKTVECRYVVYDQHWDPNTKKFILKRKILRDHIVESQSLKLQSQIRSIAHRFNGASKEKIEEFKKILRGRITFDPVTEIFTIDQTTANVDLKFKYEEEGGYQKLVSVNENSWKYFNRNWIVDMLRDLFNIHLPTDNIKQLEQVFGLNLAQIFLMPILVAVSSVLNRNMHVFTSDKSGAYPWKMVTWPYADSFANAAKYLGLIYGSESLNVLRDFDGNNLPVYQYSSLFYDIKDIADDIAETPNNILHENEIVKNRNVLGRIYLRSDTKIGDTIIKSKEKTVSDLLHESIFKDYYQELKTGKVLIQPTCFADKTRFPLFEMQLQKIKHNDESIHEILSDMSSKFDNDLYIQQMQDYIAKYRQSKVKGQLVELFNRFALVTNFQPINKRMSYSEVKLKIDKLLEHINNEYAIDEIKEDLKRGIKGKKAINTLFDDYNTKYVNALNSLVKFFPEYDVTTDRSGKLAFNEVIMNAADLYWDYDENNESSKLKFKHRLNRENRQMAKAMRRNGFLINVREDYALTELIDQWSKDHPEELQYWYNSKTGNLKTHRVFKDGLEIFVSEIELDKYYDDPTVTVKFNPIIESWHYADISMSEQINDILFGDVSTYPNKLKGKGLLSDEDYHLYGESNRLSTMFKRTMIGGSTRHKMIISRFGMDAYANVAHSGDFTDEMYNIIGHVKNDLTMDGCGFSYGATTKMENWSYKDAAVSGDRKTIFGYTDPVTGVFKEVKWAVFDLSNLRRQNSVMSEEFSIELMVQKMTSISLNATSLNLSKFWNKETAYFSSHVPGRSITSDRDLYRYDYKNGKYYKLKSLTSSLGRGTAVWEIVNERGESIKGETETVSRVIKNVYDIDQLLGGAFVFEKDTETNTLVQTDLNNEIIANILCEMGWKDKVIHYTIQHSATKCGVNNVNSVKSFYRHNPTPLQYSKMSFQYGGVQMDASHDVQHGDVSELMQAVAAMTQNGYRMDVVNDLYEAIGHVTLMSLQPLLKAREEGNDSELLRKMGKALIDSFKSGSKSTLGLAQSFMDIAESVLDTAAFNGIPFSAPTIVGSFLAEMASMLNKKGIRRRYSGLGTVQAPSHGFMLHYQIGDKPMSFKEFAEWVHSNPEFTELKGKYGDDLVESLLYDQMIIDGKITNPLIKRVNSSDPNSTKRIDDITFEDTVVIRKKSGMDLEGKVIKINAISTYDMIKNFYPEDEYEIYVWEGKGRNLAAANTVLKYKTYVGNNLVEKQSSLYDLDVTRALYYMTNMDISDLVHPVRFKVIHSAINSAMINSKVNPIEYEDVVEFLKTPVDLSDELRAKIVALLKREQVRINLQLSSLYNGKVIELPMTTQQSMFRDYSFRSVDELVAYMTSPILTVEEYIDLLNYAKNNHLFDEIAVDELFVRGYFAEDQLFKINEAKNYLSNVTVTNVSTTPPEISVGKLFLKQFGLTSADNIANIDEKFFFDKYRNFANFPQNKSLSRDKYDAMLYTSEGKQLFVMIGSNDLTRMEGLRANPKSMSVVGDSIYYGDDELCSSTRKSIRQYVNDAGQVFDFIIVESIDDIREIQNSGIFQGLRANYTKANWKELLKLQFPNVIDSFGNIRKGTAIELKVPTVDPNTGANDYNNIVVAESMKDSIHNYDHDDIVTYLRLNDECYQYEHAKINVHNTYLSFNESLNFIGARIPTQSMQSFSAAQCKIFADTTTNESYLPKTLTWIEGSDYDIDKWYLMGLEILMNGQIATYSNIAFEIGIRNAFKLPIPSGRTFYAEQNEVNSLLDVSVQNTSIPSDEDPAKLLPKKIITSSKANCELVKAGPNNWRLTLDSKKVPRHEIDRLLDVVLQEVEKNEWIAVQDKMIAEMLSEKGCMYNPSANPFAVVNAKAEPIIITDQDLDLLEKGHVNALVKALKYTQSNIIRFETSIVGDYRKSQLIRLLNSHESTKLTTHRLNTALRNKVFFAMQNVLLDPASQISLQMPIAIDGPRRAADKSDLGKQSKTMTMDNSVVKFEMQIENMSGKTGVGGAANALKAFFGASAYFNNKIYEIDDLLRKYKVESNPDVRAELGDRIYSLVKMMVFDSKLDSKLVTIGDLYWNKLIDTCNELGISHVSILNPYVADGQRNLSTYDEMGGFNILALANHLQRLNESLNSADAISAMISAATDNAKELVLAKMNATGPLLDVWCHLLATGHTFEEISEKMCSYTTNVMTRFLRKSMFNPQTKWITPEKVIDFLLGNDELVFDSSIFDAMLVSLKNNSLLHYIIFDEDENNTKRIDLKTNIHLATGTTGEYNNDTDLINQMESELKNQNVRKTVANMIQDYMSTSSRAQGLFIEFLENEIENFTTRRTPYSSESDIEMSEFLQSYYDPSDNMEPEIDEYDSEGYGSIYSNKDYEIVNLDTVKNGTFEMALRYFEEYCIPKYQLVNNPEQKFDVEWLRNLKTGVLPACEEMAMYARMLSVNKGAKTDDYEEYSWIQQMNVFINKRYAKDNSDSFEKFDFLKFMKDEEYRNRQINQYEQIKSTQNLLAMIAEADNFWSMLKLIEFNRFLIEHAAIIKLERKLADEILQVGKESKKYVNEENITIGIDEFDYRTIGKKDFAIIKRFARDVLSYNWISRIKGLKINVRKEWYKPGKWETVPAKNIKNVEINTISGLANFKKTMDEYIIPELIRRNRDNAFFQGLVDDIIEDPITGRPIKFWKPNILMGEISTSKKIESIYEAMLTGFDAVKDNYVGTNPEFEFAEQDWTIGDLFFLYDFYVNRNGFGNQAFTRFFEDTVRSQNKYSLVNSYYDFLRKVDTGEIAFNDIEYDIRDLQIYLAKKTGSKSKFNVKLADNSALLIVKFEDNSTDEVELTYDPSDFLFRLHFMNNEVALSQSSNNGIEYDGHQIVTVDPSDQEIFEAMVYQIQKMIGKVNIPIHIIKDEDFVELEEKGLIEYENDIDENRTKNASAFIYNGSVYINLDRKEPESVIHESMHIISAAMKYDPRYSSKYYEWVDEIWNSPFYEDIRSKLMERYTMYDENGKPYLFKSGSDLKEELFAEVMADRFRSKFSRAWGDGPKRKAEITKTVINILNDILGVDIDEKIEPSELGNTKLKTVLKVFNSSLFSDSNAEFVRTIVPLNQMLSTIKKELIKQKFVEYDCY